MEGTYVASPCSLGLDYPPFLSPLCVIECVRVSVPCVRLFLTMEGVPGTSRDYDFRLFEDLEAEENAVDNPTGEGGEYAESEGSDGDRLDDDVDPAELDAEDDPFDADDTDLEEELDYNPQWAPITAGLRHFPFTKENKFNVPAPGENRPYDWFKLLVDDIFLENIVKATNSYAWAVYAKPSLTPKSRINKWKELTVAELKNFIGLIIHMGTVRINRFNDYWNTSRYFDFSFVREQMSRDRFLLILRCLHFSTNDRVGCENDRLHKVRLLIDHFTTIMQTVYYPCKELSLDEGTVLWRGRLIFRQYIKGKRHKYGVKIYSLCEPNGMCVRFTIYSGKGGELGGKGHALKVVKYLMQHKLNVGHSMFMDNYYMSFPLASYLLSHKTYSTGTLRSDRKYLPKEVTSVKLKKGEKVERYAEGVLVAKWHDKRSVLYMSTEFENNMVSSTNKRKQVREKPLPIVQYNAHMKGVDRHDQLMAYYPCQHKSLRWYKKIFVHVLQMILINSFKLYQQANPRSKKTLYRFRLDILDVWLPPKTGPSPKRPRQNTNVTHVLSKTDKRTPDGSRFVRRRCKMCSKEKKMTLTVYYCAQCRGEPALCELRCFDLYHAQ